MLLRFLLPCLLFSLLLVACAFSTPDPTPDIPATVTAQVQEHLAAIPMATPLPTYTPYPTYTPVPPPTPTPTETQKWGIPNKPVRVSTLFADPNIYAGRTKLILNVCYTGVDIDDWGIFSQNGGFNKNTQFVRVSGISTRNLAEGDCFLMGVKYVGKETYCYWTSFVEWPSTFGCPSFGWKSLTLKFRVTPLGAFEKTLSH